MTHEDVYICDAGLVVVSFSGERSGEKREVDRGEINERYGWESNTRGMPPRYSPQSTSISLPKPGGVCARHTFNVKLATSTTSPSLKSRRRLISSKVSLRVFLFRVLCRMESTFRTAVFVSFNRQV